MSPKRRPGLKAPLPLGEILSGESGRRSLRLVELYRVQRRWPEIVGELLAARTWPKRIRGGALVVAAENAAWSHQLSMMRAQVLRAIGERAGVRLADIRFVSEPFSRPEEARPVEAEEKGMKPAAVSPVRGVADPELAAVLGRVRARLEELRAARQRRRR